MRVPADGTYTERCDQRAGGGDWTRVGGERLFDFRGGRAAEISLTNDASGAVAAPCNAANASTTPNADESTRPRTQTACILVSVLLAPRDQ